MTFHKNLKPLKSATEIDDKTWISKDRCTLVGVRKLSGIKIVLREPCTPEHFDLFPISKSKCTKALKSLFNWYAVGDYFGLTVYCWAATDGYVLYQPDGFAHHIVQHEEVIDQVEFYEYGTSQEEIESALEKLQTSEELVIDTETHGTDRDPDGGLCPFTGEMRYLQIWGDAYPEKVLIFDFGSRDQDKTYDRFTSALQSLVEHKTIIFHNALFDVQWLCEKVGINWSICKIRDTEIISRLCWAGIPSWLVKHSLGAVATRIEIECHDKSFQKDDFGVNAVLPLSLNYGAKDVLTTRDVFHRFGEIYKGTYRLVQHPELTSMIRLQNREIKMTERAIVPTLAMRQSGFPVDLEVMETQLEYCAGLQEKIEREISPYLSRNYCIENARVLVEILDTAPSFRKELLIKMVRYLPYLEGKLEEVPFSDSSDLLVETIHNLFDLSLPIKINKSKTTGEENECESSDDSSIKLAENDYPELSWLVWVRRWRGLAKRHDYLKSVKRSVVFRKGIPRAMCQVRLVNPLASGRLCGSSYTKAFGVNLFNISKVSGEFRNEFPNIREIFSLKRTDYSFSIHDISSSHLIIGLSESGENEFAEQLLNSEDGHATNAILISQQTGNRFNDEATYYAAKAAKDPELTVLRQMAKVGVYSCINLASPKSIQTSLAEIGIFKSLEECKVVLDSVWANMPRLKKYIYSTAKEAINSPLTIPQTAFTPEPLETYPVCWSPVTGGTGRLRYFSAYYSDYDGKLKIKANECSSHLYSSIESTIIITSFTRFYFEVVVGRPRLQAELVGSCYDDISVIAPDEFIDEVSERLWKIMTEEWSRHVQFGLGLDPDYKTGITKSFASK